MKRVVYSNNSHRILNVELSIEVNYAYTFSDIAASKELNSMDLSELDKEIVNFPIDKKISIQSAAYKQFIKFVNKVDELLEKRGFEILGESEKDRSKDESVYKGIIFNVSKDTATKHISAKILHTLRVSGHKSTRQVRRVRQEKISRAANSKDALLINNGEPLTIGEFESIVVKCTVAFPELTNIDNKEFYSYKDALKCVDMILDGWEASI